MNAAQAVLGLRGSFIHSFFIHVDKVDSLFLVGTVTCEVTHFSTVETGIIGGTRLIGIGGSSLEVLVPSSAPSLVASSMPVCIGPTKVHGHWLVVHARRSVRCVILRGLLGVVGISPSVEERVLLLVSLQS